MSRGRGPMMSPPVPRLRGLALAAAAVLLWIGACEDTRGPVDIQDPDPPSTEFFSALIVTNPVASAAVAAGAGLSFGESSSGGVEGIVFVSLSPGSISNGEAAVIRTRGTETQVTAAMVDGGFDPIPIAAVSGDTLDISIELAGGGAPLVFHSVVPPRRPPVIVRTDPPPRKRDVPLNAALLVVFSEPIDARTLTASSVQLLLEGAPVPGTVRFGDGANLTATFTPAELLVAGGEYTLLITREIADLEGDAVEQELRLSFHTASAGEASLEVGNSTSGGAFPVSPYRLTVGVAGQPPQIGPMDLNETVVFSVPAGDVTVSLDELPTNCEASGGASRTIAATVGAQAQASFSIICTPPSEFGSIRLAFTRLECQGITWAGGCWSGKGTLWTMNADGTDLRQITDGDWDVAAAVSPDGARIAFVRYLRGSRDAHIYTVAADGGAATQLTSGAGEVGWWWRGDGPVWSPDGSRIAFTHSDGSGVEGIDVVDADGTDRRTLIRSAWGPAWSPDGSTIAFFRGSGRAQEDYELWVMDADGGNPKLVLPVEYGSKGATWTADGSAITFETLHGRLWTVHPDGSNPISRSFLGGFCTGNWSADRTMYVRGSDGPCDPWLGFEGIMRLLMVVKGTRVRINADGALILPAFFP